MALSRVNYDLEKAILKLPKLIYIIGLQSGVAGFHWVLEFGSIV